MDESATNHYFGVWIAQTFGRFGEGSSTNLEYYYDRLHMEIDVFAIESSSVFCLSKSARDKLRKNCFCDVTFMLGVDVGHILEKAIEETLGLLLDVTIVEEIRLTFLLVLLQIASKV